MNATPNPLLDRLGFPPDARLVIFHADDVGMCHGSNQAFLDLFAAGIVRCGSVMVPCPWSSEILALAPERPELDLGVHLTLNSEWGRYRWGPVSTRDQASGLIDPAGNFWPQPAMTAATLDPAAGSAELRAQIEIARAAGLEFTHLDTHMGAALLPELFSTYLELAFEYRVPVLAPRGLDAYTRSFRPSGMDDAAFVRLVAELEARGMPLVDTFRITPGYHADDAEGGRAELYEAILHDLPPGITYFSLHPNRPGDIETIDPERSFWRTFEYQYFQSNRLRSFLEREEIVPIGYQEIFEVMRFG